MSKNISLFLSHYTYHLIAILFIIFFIYLFFSWFLKRKRHKNKAAAVMIDKKEAPTLITSHDIRAIAGDDIMSTQLDLARAYIELGKNKLAKKILEHVLQHGSFQNQSVAKELISHL